VNVDLRPASPDVRQWDASRRLPFADAEFEAVYHSHVLEHFGKSEAAAFLLECHRVLKSGGVIRVAVPDLEQIARLYLQALDKNVANGARTMGSAREPAEYDWIMLELYDQTVREQPGGEMLLEARNASAEHKEFLRKRLGGEIERIVAGGERAAGASKAVTPVGLRRRILRWLVGREGVRAYDIGRFRLSGEVHRWMYDSYSLARALREAGFQEPRRVEANESKIPGWEKFHLDTEVDGSVYKPDSLYMEATRG